MRLVDFGIARASTATLAHGPRMAAATATGVALGTPGYMAPEQAMGERDVDARVDVFALGCVLFECLTGAPAFAGDHALAILAKILLEEPPRLDEVLVGTPPELAALVARMLAKERTARPPDGRAVAAELAQLAAMPSLRPAVPVAPPPALSAGEQRIVSVLIAGPGSPVVDAFGPTAGDNDSPGARLRATARRHGADVDVLAGETVLAVFAGAVTASENAARCALAMATDGQARVALATGRARIGSRESVGDAIDRATSMLDGALTGAVTVDEPTSALLEGRFELRRNGGPAVLVGERAESDGVRTLLGRTTACVGRERELTTLEAFWDECARESRPRPVLVTAPAGQGKTRLAHEFVQRVRARGDGAEVSIGRADPTSAGSPLKLLSDAIKRTAGVHDGEPLETRRDKLRARVARHVRQETPRVTEFVGEIAGTPFPDEASAALRTARGDSRVMADQVRRAWEDFVMAECSAHPVLLVLEDLHWGDVSTVSFVDSAMRVMGDRPWLVLALGRTEVLELFPEVWREREVQEIRLGGLSRSASERLVREVLGERADVGTVTRVVERAAGNAFFLEELISAVAEGRGASIPESVLGIVEARLSELDPAARRVLRAGSVFGKTFWSGAVRALLGVGEHAGDVDAWLRVLADREFVHARGASRFPDEREYAFRHDLVREAAHAMLVDEDRTLGHRLAGEWLERAGERDAGVIAEHFEAAGEHERAVGAFLAAARQALDADDFAGAVARAERGVSCGASGPALGALRLAASEAHIWLGQTADAYRCGLNALEQLPAGESAWFDAARISAVAAFRFGRQVDLLALADRIERVVAAESAAVPRANAIAAVAHNLFLAGDAERAARLMATCADCTDDRVRARFAQTRGIEALMTGDVAAYLRENEFACELFLANDARRDACGALVGVGYARALLGDNERAEQTLRSALADATRMGLGMTVANVLHNLGPVLARQQRFDEARAVEIEAIRVFAAQRAVRLEGASRIYLAEILLAAGEIDAAHSEAVRAADLLAAWPLLAYAQATVARIALARGDVGAATTAIEAAVRGVDSVEAGESTIRLVRAEVLQACGNLPDARETITAARDRLLARAAKISDAALRASFLERVPDHARTLDLARELAPP